MPFRIDEGKGIEGIGVACVEDSICPECSVLDHGLMKKVEQI